MTAWLPAAVVILIAAARPRLAWRWLTGLPLDGPPGHPRYRTDASWNLPGTRRLHPVPVTRWHWWRRRRRAGIRSGCTLAAVALAQGLIASPAWTLAVLAALAAAGIALTARRAMAKVTGWQHHRAYVQPLTAAIRHELGAPPERLMIEPDRSAVVMTLTEEFTGSPRDREAITRAVTAKVGELEADWSGMRGRKPQVVFAKGTPPPPRAGWADVAALVERAGPDEIVFGLGKKRADVTASLSGDSPHVAFNMGSGGGKTNLGSLCSLQFLHRGDLALFIDAKLISYPWARCLPNVAYAGMIPEIHALLVWLGIELKHRNSLALAGLQPSGAIRADVGPRLVIFAEELNFVIPQLKRYWADMRSMDKDLPKRSPALDAIGDIAFAGRQVRMHIFFIGQMITAAATGANDSSVRGNIGISCMARYTPSSWSKMTAAPMPPVPTVPGRIQVVTAAGVRETQVPYLHLDDPDEAVAAASAQWAREYATGGKFTPCPAGMPGVTAVPGVTSYPQLVHAGSEQGDVSVTSPVPPALPPTAVTLARACELGILRCSKVAAQKRSHRPGFPEHIGMDGPARVWDALELQAYEAGRVRVTR